MHGVLKHENVTLRFPSCISQAQIQPQVLEWCVIHMGNSGLLVIPSHKSCKLDHETHLVSISSYITSLSHVYRSQEVLQSESPHFHLCVFLTLKQKISSISIILRLNMYPSPHIESVPRKTQRHLGNFIPHISRVSESFSGIFDT